MRSAETWRMIALALVLGVAILGPALLPSHVLLPMDPRGHEPRATLELEPAERLEVAREAVLHGCDKLQQFLPFDRAVADAWSHGEFPLWHPGLLCGTPLLAQGTSRAFYPSALLFQVVDPAQAYAWVWLAHLVLGGTFAFRTPADSAQLRGPHTWQACASSSRGTSWARAPPDDLLRGVWTLPALGAVLTIVAGEKRS